MLASATEAAAEHRKAVDEKNRQILALRTKMGDFLAESLKAAQERRNARNQAIYGARAEAERLVAEITGLRRSAIEDGNAAENYSVSRNDDAARLRSLGARYESIRNKAFRFDGATVCPYCGNPYTDEQLAEDREQKNAEFLAEQKIELKKIEDEATGLKATIAKTDGWIAERKKAADEKLAKADALEAALAQARAALAEAEGAPEVNIDEEERKVRASAGYVKLTDEERKLVAEIDAMANGSGEAGTRDLMAERRKLEADITIAQNKADEKLEPIRARKAVAGERARILGLIADAEKEAAAFADEVARLERLEDRAAEYVKAEIDSMEGAISKLFKVARWKMFSTTIDGGLQDMCEVTSPDGVPYRSMNDAQKILCGLDVIRVFSEAYDCSAPIFIDNAESITRTDFGTAAQVIRLVVTPGADTLNTVAEGPAK